MVDELRGVENARVMTKGIVGGVEVRKKGKSFMSKRSKQNKLVQKLFHRHHLMGRTLQECRFSPANNLHLTDKIRAHLQDQGLMGPIRETSRLECPAENGHHIPLEEVSLSGCVCPIHQLSESRLKTWVRRSIIKYTNNCIHC